MTHKRLNTGKGSEIQTIPTGGEGIGGLGIVAPWYARIVYQINTENDMAEEVTADFKSKSPSGWYRLYFTDYGKAVEAQKELGEQYGPQTVWRFQTGTANTLNLNEKEKWGDTISFDVSVKTFASRKSRHEYQLMALPAMVASIADLYEFDNPGFDLSELAVADDDHFDGEFQAKMIGDPDEVKGGEAYFTESVLFKRRAALWAALGEDDPFKSLTPSMAEKLTNPSKKRITQAEKLIECLDVAASSWTEPVWARVAQVKDPREDAIMGNGNRLSVAVVQELFYTKEDAVASLGDAVAEGTSVSNDKPELPKSWEALGEKEFTDAIMAAIEEGQSTQAIAGSLEISPKEAATWKAYLSK